MFGVNVQRSAGRIPNLLSESVLSRTVRGTDFAHQIGDNRLVTVRQIDPQFTFVNADGLAFLAFKEEKRLIVSDFVALRAFGPVLVGSDQSQL